MENRTTFTMDFSLEREQWLYKPIQNIKKLIEITPVPWNGLLHKFIYLILGYVISHEANGGCLAVVEWFGAKWLSD